MNKNETRLLQIIPILLSVILISCSSSSNSNNDSASPLDPFAVTWNSGCRNVGSSNVVHFVSFDKTKNTFSANSITYRDVSCNDKIRDGRNILSGTFSLGNDITTTGGFVATELNIIYSTFTTANVQRFDSAPFDIVYVDPNTNTIYLGLKTSILHGNSINKRPNTVDFNNAWTTQ